MFQKVINSHDKNGQVINLQTIIEKTFYLCRTVRIELNCAEKKENPKEIDVHACQPLTFGK